MIRTRFWPFNALSRLTARYRGESDAIVLNIIDHVRSDVFEVDSVLSVSLFELWFPNFRSVTIVLADL